MVALGYLRLPSVVLPGLFTGTVRPSGDSTPLTGKFGPNQDRSPERQVPCEKGGKVFEAEHASKPEGVSHTSGEEKKEGEKQPSPSAEIAGFLRLWRGAPVP